VDNLLPDLRYAVRSVLQRPGFTLAALLTLALGIGATSAIFSVVQGVLLRPLPYDAIERLAIFGTGERDGDPDQISNISIAIFDDWRDQSSSFESMALYTPAQQLTLTNLGEAKSVAGAQVTPDFFRVFGAEPMTGRTFTEDESRPNGPQAVVVSHQFWQERLGGDTDVLGRTLELGGEPRPIVGVTPPGFEYPAGARLYLPVRNSFVYLLGIARVRPDVTLDQARTELIGIANRLEREYPESNIDVTARLRSLTDVMVGDVRRALYVLLGAVFMVLLIACANVANLLLVRGSSRSAELAVRTVLGASRRRIVTQLMTENLMLALIGGVLGLLLASWAVDLLRAFAPADLPRVDEISVDTTVLGFTLLVVLAAALIFGLLPALRLSHTTLAESLRGSGRGDLGARRGWGRSLILVAEVALAAMLLLGAGLMMRSLAGLYDIDPGFDSDDIAHFTIELPDATYDSPERSVLFMVALRERLASMPGVEDVGLVTPMPLGPGMYIGGFNRLDRQSEPGSEPYALLRAIDAGGFATLGISLEEGRGVEASDRNGSMPVALINRAAADRYWPGEDPIGRQIDVRVNLGFDEQPRTIVGIITDIRATSLTEPVEPEILIPYDQAGAGGATLLIRATDASAVLAGARTQLRALDPNIPMIRPGTVAELISAQTAATRFYFMLLGIFAALAVLLAAVGIYGVVAFIVAHRSREIGMRLALGAHIHEVFRLIVWQGVRPALIGLTFGVLGGIAAGRVIAGLLFGVRPHDPLTFAGVTTLLLGVVILACVVPAGRASRIPPASALRGE
jgi:putative ABC transport system permease protein